MACFTVPLATAVVASAAKTALPASAQKNPFVAKLGWLGKMMFGGSFLLAIEHVYHGEIIFTPPFLTAVKEGPEATSDMLHEMATRGVAMAVYPKIATGNGGRSGGTVDAFNCHNVFSFFVKSLL